MPENILREMAQLEKGGSIYRQNDAAETFNVRQVGGGSFDAGPNDVLICNPGPADTEITLPSVSETGMYVRVKKDRRYDNDVIVYPNGNEQIDNHDKFTLRAAFSSVAFVSNGSRYKSLDSGQARPDTITIPTTQLKDGEFISQRIFVPNNRTIRIIEAGVQNDANKTPSGLDARGIIEDGSGNIQSNKYTVNAGHSYMNDFLTGPAYFEMRTDNATGSKQNASSFHRVQWANDG